MAFLDEIGHGQTIMTETGCQRDDKAHMGSSQLMKRRFITVLFPAHS